MTTLSPPVIHQRPNPKRPWTERSVPFFGIAASLLLIGPRVALCPAPLQNCSATPPTPSSNTKATKSNPLFPWSCAGEPAAEQPGYAVHRFRPPSCVESKSRRAASPSSRRRTHLMSETPLNEFIKRNAPAAPEEAAVRTWLRKTPRLLFFFSFTARKSSRQKIPHSACWIVAEMV